MSEDVQSLIAQAAGIVESVRGGMAEEGADLDWRMALLTARDLLQQAQDAYEQEREVRHAQV